MSHISTLICIIIIVGAVAGLTNFLLYFYKGLIKNKYEFIKYILTGIGAATLVPLLLNMLSSNLIEINQDYNKINYFVFAGFCYIAGYFSDKFINSIGEKVLKDLESTNKKVEEVMGSAKQNEEKLDILVSSESEIDEIEDNTEIDTSKLTEHCKFTDDDMETQINKVLKSFLGKHKFRTPNGIAKELAYSINIVESILNGLQEQGIFKILSDKRGKKLWTLTNVGKMFAQRQDKK